MSNVVNQDEEEFFDVHEMVMEADASPSLHADREQLEKCGHWLLSIPRDDCADLCHTPEYADFLKAFEKMGQAHRRVLAMADTELDKSIPDGFSFLQHMAVDDVLLRVLELLDCQSLIRTSETCSRFKELSHRSAKQRTYHMAKDRQLNHVMKLLRAQEEIDGSSSPGSILDEINTCHVPVPILGLEKRVVVTGADDPEYNGVYYCTGCNSNGFFFTKPRNRESRAPATNAATTPLQAMEDMSMLEQLMENHTEGFRDDKGPGPGNIDRPTEAGGLLRCTISKKYSDVTLYWYMSKEVESVRTPGGMPEICEVYSYYSALLSTGPLDLVSYPAQTSLLISGGQEPWDCLPGLNLVNAPTVEVLD